MRGAVRRRPMRPYYARPYTPVRNERIKTGDDVQRRARGRQHANERGPLALVRVLQGRGVARSRSGHRATAPLARPRRRRRRSPELGERRRHAMALTHATPGPARPSAHGSSLAGVPSSGVAEGWGPGVEVVTLVATYDTGRVTEFRPRIVQSYQGISRCRYIETLANCDRGCARRAQPWCHSVTPVTSSAPGWSTLAPLPTLALRGCKGTRGPRQS